MRIAKQLWMFSALGALLLAGLAGCSDNTTGGTIYFADAKGDGINFNLKDGKGDGLATDASDDATATDDDATGDASTDGPAFLYYDLGVNAYVVKPVAFDGFIDAVRQLGVFWALINERPPEIGS